jgi:hypothetical protein
VCGSVEATDAVAFCLDSPVICRGPPSSQPRQYGAVLGGNPEPCLVTAARVCPPSTTVNRGPTPPGAMQLTAERGERGRGRHGVRWVGGKKGFAVPAAREGKQSVATPQAARGWAFAPCKHIKIQSS